ncbi:MAG TPA: hypothetical protein VGQ25_10785 [Gemmatimonadales bacterium]|nr:hypothetical protein [Gemmatimonadales bacterium]
MAGRLKAERVVAVVADSYYRETGHGKRETLRPLMDVIERAHPGVIELAGSAEKPGFAVRLAQRPFPSEYEEALREAAQAALSRQAGTTFSVSRVPSPGLWSRFYTAVRRFFTAST